MKKIIFITLMLYLTQVAVCDVKTDIGIPVEVNLVNPESYSGPVRRSPVKIPPIYLYHHTLVFDSSYMGAHVSMIKDGVIIENCDVAENCSINIPENLDGVLELYIELNNLNLQGFIYINTND